MIITKAYIKEMPQSGNNIFKVNIPLMSDNTGEDAIFEALLCTDPSCYNGYNVGDCVFVTFEDEKYNTAIILGKLYTSVPISTTSYTILNELKVSEYASLPPNTKFGEHTAQDFTNLYNAAMNGGTGTIDDEDLKQYVKWVNTERVDPETSEEIDYYSNKIRCVTGEEYEKIIKHEEPFEDEDDEEIANTIYFLSSPAPGETGREDGNLDANLQG